MGEPEVDNTSLENRDRDQYRGLQRENGIVKTTPLKVLVVFGSTMSFFTVAATFINSLVAGAPAIALVLIIPVAWLAFKLSQAAGNWYDEFFTR